MTHYRGLPLVVGVLVAGAFGYLSGGSKTVEQPVVRTQRIENGPSELGRLRVQLADLAARKAIADAALAKARKQIEVMRALAVAYRGELVFVDGLHAEAQKGTK